MNYAAYHQYPVGLDICSARLVYVRKLSDTVVDLFLFSVYRQYCTKKAEKTGTHKKNAPKTTDETATD
ncbi:MAG: hypothetical protein ACRCYN_00015 [Plesiomonas sp.]